MDEFLSNLYVEYFKKWILFQHSNEYDLHIDPKDKNMILIDNDNSSSRITFNRFKIIELCVINKKNNKLEFYIHFQMQNLAHAKKLFEEMIECIHNISNRSTLKILLSCSGGLTTGYFAEKLNQMAELLELDYHFQALGLEKAFTAVEDFDILLLAPQVSYQCAKIQRILSNKIVLKIPTLVFAKYDCLKLLEFIKDSQQTNKSDERVLVKLSSQYTDKVINDYVLCLSIYKNNCKNFINYRLYGKNQALIHEKQIIKDNISIQDIYDVLNTVLLHFLEIDFVAISLPGIIYNGYVSSSFVEGLSDMDFKQILELKYNKSVILENDVNCMAVGYYVSQSQYHSLSFLFQPQGLNAGLGTIINGQLIKGCNNFAGEIKFMPLPLIERNKLSLTPEGTYNLIALIIQAIMSVIAPPVIVIYNDLVYDTNLLKKQIMSQIDIGIRQLDFEIIKVDNIQEYILLGLLALSIKS